MVCGQRFLHLDRDGFGVRGVRLRVELDRLAGGRTGFLRQPFFFDSTVRVARKVI